MAFLSDSCTFHELTDDILAACQPSEPLNIKDYAIESKSKRTAELITSRRIIFTPDTDLKEELAKTAIQITCFDRDGKEVKRVTSTSGEVEDPDSGGGENPENSGGSSSSE